MQVRAVAADAAIEQELQQLRAENEALRRALAQEQGVSPTEVLHIIVVLCVVWHCPAWIAGL